MFCDNQFTLGGPPCLDPTGISCHLRRPKRSPQGGLDKIVQRLRTCLDPTGIYCVPENQAHPTKTPKPKDSPKHPDSNSKNKHE